MHTMNSIYIMVAYSGYKPSNIRGLSFSLVEGEGKFTNNLASIKLQPPILATILLRPHTPPIHLTG